MNPEYRLRPPPRRIRRRGSSLSFNRQGRLRDLCPFVWWDSQIAIGLGPYRLRTPLGIHLCPKKRRNDCRPGSTKDLFGVPMSLEEPRLTLEWRTDHYCSIAKCVSNRCEYCPSALR